MPEYKQYVQDNGTIATIADKAIYGLPESGLLWYLDLKTTITKLGYITNEADPCCFHKYNKSNNTFSHIAVHVDDILGMKISTKPNGDIELSMPKYVEQILKDNNVEFVGNTPCKENKTRDANLT